MERLSATTKTSAVEEYTEISLDAEKKTPACKKMGKKIPAVPGKKATTIVSTVLAKTELSATTL